MLDSIYRMAFELLKNLIVGVKTSLIHYLITVYNHFMGESFQGYSSKEFQIWCVDAFWDRGVSCTIFGSL